MIEILDQLLIPEEEVSFTASRSSGPGGQNVNKVSTRVTLWFDVVNSQSLSEEQKSLILRRLALRVNKEGLLQVASQRTRSQAFNRQDAIEKFVALLRGALMRDAPRKRTRIPTGAKERRIKDKKLRGQRKQLRSRLGEATD